jgi:hypothetical protein
MYDLNFPLLSIWPQNSRFITTLLLLFNSQNKLFLATFIFHDCTKSHISYHQSDLYLESSELKSYSHLWLLVVFSVSAGRFQEGILNRTILLPSYFIIHNKPFMSSSTLYSDCNWCGVITYTKKYPLLSKNRKPFWHKYSSIFCFRHKLHTYWYIISVTQIWETSIHTK